MALLDMPHIPRLHRVSPSTQLSLTVLEATSIVGTVAHECTVTPVMNASYSRTVKSRVQEANQPKRQVQILSDAQAIPDGSYLYNPKSSQPFGKFTGGTARSKAEAQNNKATRIPKNELLDILFKCFQEYEYWSLKGLKEYIKQPEVTSIFRPPLITVLLKGGTGGNCSSQQTRTLRA
jgi:transcription initiation factor TFIIF subunit beta